MERIAVLAPITSVPSLLDRRDISWVTSPILGEKVWILKGFSLPWAVVGVTRRMRYFNPSHDMKHMTLDETVSMMSIRRATILPLNEETGKRQCIESHLVRLISVFKRYPTKKNFNEVLQYTLPGYSKEIQLSASKGITENLQVFLHEDGEDDEDSNQVGPREWNDFKESFTKIPNGGETDWQTISDLIRDTDTSWAACHRPLGDDELNSLITSVSQSQSSGATRARCLRILAKSLPADHPKLAIFFQAIKDGLGQDRLVRLRHVACGVLEEVVTRPGWLNQRGNGRPFGKT
jgi:hypothetical protein